MKHILFLMLFVCIGCDETNEQKESKYVETVFKVKDNHKTKFQEDYVTFIPLDNSSVYWIKGERYKNTYPYKKDDLVLIKHNKYQNNDIKYIKLLKFSE